MRTYLYQNLLKKAIIFFLCAGIPMESAFALIPNDPFAAQWSYNDVGAYKAWESTVGSRDVVVAVIDNGFDAFHPEFTGNVWVNEKEIADNGIDDDGNGYIDDTHGWNFLDNSNDPRPSVFGVENPTDPDDDISHGTMVAGIIGARGNNSLFGAGLNWHVKLMNLKVLGNTGSQPVLTPIIEAIHYAVDNGAHVINISLVGPEDEDVGQAVKYAYDHGVAVVAASGNDYFSLNDNPRYPVCADRGALEQWVLGVSAIKESHHRAQFANIGDCIDVTAPGVHVSTTLRYAPRYGLTEYYGGPFSGTSFAAPFVSGAAALLKSIRPDWRAKEIYDAILGNVHKTPPNDEYAYAQSFGRGLLQIDRAVAAAFKTAGRTAVINEIRAVSYGGGETMIAARQVANGQATDLSVVRKPAVAGLEAVQSYVQSGQIRHAAVIAKTARKKTTREIAVYDSQWVKLRSWPAPFSGPLSLTIAGLSANPQIVVAPKQKSTILWQAYSLTGKPTASQTLAAEHAGVALGSALHTDPELLAVYADGKNYALERFDLSFKLRDRIILPIDAAPHAVAAGDIDGNGADEYIIGSGSHLWYVSALGKLQRKFIAYGKAVPGMALAVGDYDGDGADDVVTAPAGGTEPIRVWSGRSKKLAEWRPFGEAYAGGIGLLADYK